MEKIKTEYGYKEVFSNGDTYYRNYKNKLHRTDGPAIEYTEGTKEYYLNGALHRTDGPAIDCLDGSRAYFVNGIRHKEDGPALKWAGGDELYFKHGKLHRTDGPAIICDHFELHFINGKYAWKR